jgi:hypothetical protein
MTRVLALLVVVLAPAVALAQAPRRSADRDPPAVDDCARVREGRPCRIEIEPEQVGGQRAGHLGDRFDARRWSRHTSLIRVRRGFDAEIVRAAERL